jgi:hypothetical protein
MNFILFLNTTKTTGDRIYLFIYSFHLCQNSNMMESEWNFVEPRKKRDMHYAMLGDLTITSTMFSLDFELRVNANRFPTLALNK